MTSAVVGSSAMMTLGSASRASDDNAPSHARRTDAGNDRSARGRRLPVCSLRDHAKAPRQDQGGSDRELTSHGKAGSARSTDPENRNLICRDRRIWRIRVHTVDLSMGWPLSRICPLAMRLWRSSRPMRSPRCQRLPSTGFAHHAQHPLPGAPGERLPLSTPRCVKFIQWILTLWKQRAAMKKV